MDPAKPLPLFLLPLLLVGSTGGLASASAQGNNLEICLLPLEKGPCRALIPRFYYDRNQQTCREFKYGGCLGNANNFHSLELCEHTCGNIEIPSFCSSPRDEGLCAANVTRYYFNSRNKTCETFTYTGCGGNENNFYYLDDCDRVCIKGSKALPIQSSGKGVE
ncbi:tissue factor pathway inhibitor 2 isoform X2 [Phodopus roborovskii]|uniref:tissue factor pathway inhibitor 2 isoform X2 n=1 Tax=Phodopus roborovskii TaxID=109678 RepID=UPI0021E4DBB8|nr:tissue factor pathway inhibitor 2 isoform X2 [Phodopus roborovskii]